MAVRAQHQKISLALCNVILDAAKRASLRDMDRCIWIAHRDLLGHLIQLFAGKPLGLSLVFMHAGKFGRSKAIGSVARLGFDHVDETQLRTMTAGVNSSLSKDFGSGI